MAEMAKNSIGRIGRQASGYRGDPYQSFALYVQSIQGSVCRVCKSSILSTAIFTAKTSMVVISKASAYRGRVCSLGDQVNGRRGVGSRD